MDASNASASSSADLSTDALPFDIDYAAESHFWSNVDRGAPGECWPWTAGTSDTGYGAYQWPESVSGYAHRYAVLIAHGTIPDGMEVRHTCDNPICCNPHHLKIGTRQDNMRDKCKRGRQNSYGKALFSDDEVYQIRVQYHRDGYSQSALSTLYGVSQPCISNIVRGKRYTNVPMPPEAEEKTNCRVTVNDIDTSEETPIARRNRKRKEKMTSNLTPDDVETIRVAYWTTDANRHDLASRYNLHDQYVYMIVTGRKWSWAPGPTSKEEAL